MEKCNQFENADAAIASLPPFLQESFNALVSAKAKPVQSEHVGNGSRLAFQERAEPIIAAPEPAYTGKITPSIYVERGAELAIWRNGDTIKVELRNLLGQTFYGKLSGVLGAEGSFGSPDTEEDKAFLRSIFEAIVQSERENPQKGENLNYSRRATALWTNRDLSGLPQSRAFLVITWKTYANGGAPYPTDALLFDGDKHHVFPLSKQTVSTPSHPQWKGRAA